MAWPPPVLPTNRTNEMPQQDTHPADHNAANLAINDLVAKVTDITAVPTKVHSANGLATPIALNALLASLVVPAPPKDCLALISYHCLVTVPAGNGGYDLALRINGGINLQWRGGPVGSDMIDGFLPTAHATWMGPLTIEVVCTSAGAGAAATVYNNGNFHRLSCVSIAGS